MDAMETLDKIKEQNYKIYFKEIKPKIFRGYGFTFNY